LHGRCHASELFIAIFGGVVAMKKGGKKYIIYVVLNSYVISNFYLEGVCKHKCPHERTLTGRDSRVYPNGRGSERTLTGRGSRVYPKGRGSQVRPGWGRRCARALPPSRLALHARGSLYEFVLYNLYKNVRIGTKTTLCMNSYYTICITIV
jgi:hypothetical protein